VPTARDFMGSPFSHGGLSLHALVGQQTRPLLSYRYDDLVGDWARKKLGTKRWNRRVRRALVALDSRISSPTHPHWGGQPAKVDADKLQRVRSRLAAKLHLFALGAGCWRDPRW